MTTPPSGFVEEADLHAFVDGILDPDQRRRVEEHLLHHPEDAALVESWRRQNAAIRAVYEPILREVPAPSLRSAAAQVSTPSGAIESGATHWGRPGVLPRVRRREDILAQQRRQAIFASVLAVLAVAAVAALATFIFSGRSEHHPIAAISAPQGYVARAGLTYATYVSDQHPVEIDASRLEELSNWLKVRVGFSKVPDLSQQGMRLLGGRVAPGVAAPAGFLIYERPDGGRLGLYFERSVATISQQASKSGSGVTAIEWRTADFAFVFIGPLSLDLMQTAAEKAAAQIIGASQPQ